jgi:ATP-dependent 26S proteasome regulatory subunit
MAWIGTHATHGISETHVAEVSFLKLSACTLIFLGSMSVERDIRFDLIAGLCPNTTGAELRSVTTEVRILKILMHLT